jgi:hypothetical protein
MILNNIDEIDELLKEFDTLPKIIKQPTYLELCKYPYNRFEEICSRLLSYYLSPTKEHGFKDLFLRSLLEILQASKEIYYRFDGVNIILEENAEGKRLDILIQADNNFVIGIENKITASLYNPLEIYKTRIDLYSGQKFCVVLTLRPISSKEELILLKNNGFVNLTYSAYFSRIKLNLGNYITDGNSKYLIFMTDFIQTIENMNDQNILNPQLSNFFFDNSSKIESIIELYNEYNRRIEAIQAERIAAIKEKISEVTKASWDDWEGWDLVYATFNSNKPKIGIEASFDSTKENALGKFNIYITTWNLQDWNYYEKNILSKFPTKKLEKVDNRAKLYIDTILDNDEDLILKSLVSIYDFLYELTKE